jgi:hypothetical protein
MGGCPYWYFVAYDADVQRALDALREREFAAGRYNPVVTFPFDPGPVAPAHPAHPNIAAAFQDAAQSGDGTRSILDIDHVSSEREMGAASPLPEEDVEVLFGTVRPTRAMVDDNLDGVFAMVDRGECVYVPIYEGERAVELLFAGYSYD